MKEEFLTALLQCHLMDARMAFAHFGLTEEELEDLVKQQVLAIELVQKGEELIRYYAVEERAERSVKEETGFKGEVYRGFIAEHDVRLMEFYLELQPTERKTWRTRDDMTKEYRLPGTIDGAFTNQEGIQEGVEVLSKNAKPSAVEKAENFLNQTPIKKMNYLTY